MSLRIGSIVAAPPRSGLWNHFTMDILSLGRSERYFKYVGSSMCFARSRGGVVLWADFLEVSWWS
jgi:hypothetical protein